MQRSKYEINERRTAELNLSDLLVVSDKGDQNHFFCILEPSIAHPTCPRCGNSMARNQGTIHRDYLDVIRRGYDAVLITVSLEFRKSKCKAHGCECVYYPKFSFASSYARTTRRLDDAVVRMVLRDGCSYAEVSEELEGKLSRRLWPRFSIVE